MMRAPPRGLKENRAWRREMLKATQEPGKAREQIRKACAEDVVYWLNAVGNTYDPRREEGRRDLPFVTWEFQDEALREMAAAFGKEDLLIEKSRDMGASWLVLALFVHQWEFRGKCALGLSSSTEALVDSGHNPKSLFWKCRYLLEHQPKWLVEKRGYFSKELLLYNKLTGSTLTGFTTTADLARGDRLLAIMIDEYAAFEFGDGYRVNASTHAATNSRFFNSTYQGAAGQFYDLSRVAKSGGMKLISLPWWLHPEKRIGLYHDEKGKARSPWYDLQCKRLGVAALIAAELDMDPAGSAGQFFPADLIDKLLALDVRTHYERGRIEGKYFVEDAQGPLWLWMHPRTGRTPFGEKYVVGCDIATGSGASNSVASVASQTTGEKVAELASSRMSPDEFAEAVVALCRWANDACLIWESNGPGGRFGLKVIEAGYRNVYYRQNEQSISRKMTDTPGWAATDQNKRAVYGGYVTALLEGRFVNRCKAALEECRLIIWDANGKIVNSHAVASIDPTAARDNHADRPTADALACKALADLGPRAAPEQREVEPDPMTFLGRRKIRELERAKAEEW